MWNSRMTHITSVKRGTWMYPLVSGKNGWWSKCLWTNHTDIRSLTTVSTHVCFKRLELTKSHRTFITYVRSLARMSTLVSTEMTSLSKSLVAYITNILFIICVCCFRLASHLFTCVLCFSIIIYLLNTYHITCTTKCLTINIIWVSRWQTT